MAVRSIVVVPHEALRTKAEEISDITDEIRTLALDMADTMYRAPGVGLAANQVGIPVSLIVLDVEYAYQETKDRKKNPVFLINAKICLSDGKAVREEGCLSVPDFALEIVRPEKVQVQALDLDGNPVTIEAEGLLARALQHEIDHLNAITVLDHASSLKRGLYLRKARRKSGRNH